ncbi:MAG: 2-oxo acid dehydrogenase subunit E2, partial [Burkholderiales bacterium]
RARSGQLRSSEYTDATITVSNLGELGAQTLYGVIYPPQVALVGFGRVATKPWVDQGSIVAARVVHATLSADHRVTDGTTGARFLARLEEKLSRPEDL